jgi:hypothetical protein
MTSPTTSLLAPPAPPVGRARRLLAPGVTIGGLTLATVALHFRDPHQSGSWGFCPSAAMGISCPGCGGLRAVNDLTNGDLAGALSSNLLVTLTIPFAIALLLLWVTDRWRGRTREPDATAIVRAAVAFCAVAVAFAVVRNLEFGAWLAP